MRSKRASAAKRTFSDRHFEVLGLDGKSEQVWKASSNSTTVVTDFRIIFLPEKAGRLDPKVETLAIVWESQKLSAIPLLAAPPGPPKPKLASVTLSFIGNEKYPSVAFDAEFGVVEPSGSDPLTRWTKVGAGELWKADHLTQASPRLLDKEIERTESLTLYVKLTAVQFAGGRVIHEYTQHAMVGQPTSYTSKTHTPNTVLDYHDLLRWGFVPEAYIWKKRQPVALVKGDWKGRIRVYLRYGGNAKEWDESKLVVFENGKTDRGSDQIKLYWSGNGFTKQ